MAMSAGNSLYVAATLLSDPWQRAQDCRVKRIVGNVGRPGIAMMIPPQDPRMRVLEHDSWHLINHVEFSGTPEDCFQHTTLHLSFSDWEMPIDVGTHGARDTEIFFLEAPISVHDRGRWIADLDILKTLSDDKCRRIIFPPCSCGDFISDPMDGFSDMTSIDTWEELLESPLEMGVVRAHANWQARLAAAALSIQRGHQTWVLPENVCWRCFPAWSNNVVSESFQPLSRDRKKRGPDSGGVSHTADEESDENDEVSRENGEVHGEDLGDGTFPVIDKHCTEDEVGKTQPKKVNKTDASAGPSIIYIM